MDNDTQAALGVNNAPWVPAPKNPTTPPGGIRAGAPQPLTEGQVAQGTSDTQQKMAGIQSDFDKQYAAIPKGDLPNAEFHPLPPKESSQLFSLLMVIGALGGRATHTPMTAAMNNLTGIMRGQKDKNDSMIAEQKDQFKINFDAGMAKYKGMMEEKRNILEKYHYDMAAAQGELNTWKLQHGVSDAVAKASETQHHHMQTSMDAASKLANDLKIAGIKGGVSTKAEQTKAKTALTNKARELAVKKPKDRDKIEAQLKEDIASLDAQPAEAAPAGKSFASEADAEAAAKAGTLQVGDKITIGGVSGTWK